jgi:hypothetical protein
MMGLLLLLSVVEFLMLMLMLLMPMPMLLPPENSKGLKDIKLY